jgi:hypothetical protein
LPTPRSPSAHRTRGCREPSIPARAPFELKEHTISLKVYAVHPLTSYGAEHERRQLEALRKHFPRADVLNPATMFNSDDEWLEGWRDVIDKLYVLAVFADEEGYIGAGCLLEITDAIACGVPIVALDQDGQLHGRPVSRPTDLRDLCWILAERNLVQSLLRSGLVDRLNLWLFPLLLGSGKKVFDGGALPTGAATGSIGHVYQRYAPPGERDCR